MNEEYSSFWKPHNGSTYLLFMQYASILEHVYFVHIHYIFALMLLLRAYNLHRASVNLMLLQLFRNDFYENFPKGPQHDTYNFRVPDSLLPYQWWVVFEDITPRQTEALDIYVKHRRKRELGECTLIALSSNETKWWRTFQKKLAARWDEALQM